MSMNRAELVSLLVSLCVSFKQNGDSAIFDRIVKGFKYLSNITDDRISEAVKAWLDHSDRFTPSYIDGAIRWGIRKNLQILSVGSAAVRTPIAPATIVSAPVEIDCWTDGSCNQQAGIGSWGVILKFGNHEKQLSGKSDSKVTNNMMELQAAIEAVKAVKVNEAIVHIHSDSQIVCGYKGYKDNNWKTKAGKDVANAERWLEFQRYIDDKKLVVDFVKVAGHSGDPMNERCDKLAVAARK